MVLNILGYPKGIRDVILTSSGTPNTAGAGDAAGAARQHTRRAGRRAGPPADRNLAGASELATASRPGDYRHVRGAVRPGAGRDNVGRKS